MTILYNTTNTTASETGRRLLSNEFPETINGYDVKDQKCTLVLTPYGDMSSFVGHPDNMEGAFFQPDSTGYITIADTPLDMDIATAPDKILFTDIVEEFDCSGASNGSLPLNETNFMTTNLQGLAGRGLLLKLSGTDNIIGFSVIRYDNGAPKADVVVQDVNAVCTVEDKLTLMLYSNFTTQDDKVLRAHFQP